MRKLLVLGAAIVAVLSLATIAQGQDYDDSHVWFFGNCDNQYEEPDTITSSSLFLGGSCRGIGIFLGDWDPSSIASRVSYEAMDEFGGNWEVDYLKAINIFGGPPAPGSDYGCGPQSGSALTPVSIGGGLWIAIFSVVACEPEPEPDPDGPLLAVAYIDNDVNDGGYNESVDTLIAKVIDYNLDGNVSPGDYLISHRYPLDLDANATGAFTRAVNLISFVSNSEPHIVTGLASGSGFDFRTDGTMHLYQEAAGATQFHDSFSGLDRVVVSTSSTSLPEQAVAETFLDRDTDDPFIDVEIFAPERLLAVAYVDNNTADGGYNDAVDTLIAKLVDTDANGTLDNGDRIITNQYPLDFVPGGLGTFGTTRTDLVAITIDTATSTWITVHTGTKSFSFFQLAGNLEGYEETEGGSFSTLFLDGFGIGMDRVQAVAESPSVPGTVVANITQDVPADEGFVDVEIFIVDP